MTPPLSMLTRLYWEACQSVRGRNEVTRETALAFLMSQAFRPAHPIIYEPCRRMLAAEGFSAIEGGQ